MKAWTKWWFDQQSVKLHWRLYCVSVCVCGSSDKQMQQDTQIRKVVSHLIYRCGNPVRADKRNIFVSVLTVYFPLTEVFNSVGRCSSMPATVVLTCPCGWSTGLVQVTAHALSSFPDIVTPSPENQVSKVIGLCKIHVRSGDISFSTLQWLDPNVFRFYWL
jgi:hypothetical protein